MSTKSSLPCTDDESKTARARTERLPRGRRKRGAPSEAPNEGARCIRELLLRRSAAQIARTVGCDEVGVRRWAHGDRLPSRQFRARLLDAYTIPLDAWDRETSRRELITRPLELVTITGPLELVTANDAPKTSEGPPANAAEAASSPWRAPPAAIALAAALEAMTTGHARILAEALRRMLER